jgi:DNA polymerase I-like protein with 3'-5' exonuclease and polymerase domains
MCKQIDFRILAELSNDKEMFKLFENDRDLYSDMASKFFNVPEQYVTKEQRKLTKLVCLGVLFTKPKNTKCFIESKIADIGLEVCSVGWAVNGLITQFISTYPSAYKFIQENENIIKLIQEFEKINYPVDWAEYQKFLDQKSLEAKINGILRRSNVLESDRSFIMSTVRSR